MPLGKQEILQTTVEGKNCLYEVYGRFSSKTCEQNYYLRRLKMLLLHHLNNEVVVKSITNA